jgi:hypothetical protein
MADEPIYHKLQGIETAKAYEAFSIYRDMGVARSITKVAQELDKSRTQIGKWSERHNWVERVRIFDDDQDVARQQEAMESRKQEHRDQLMAFGIKHTQLGKQAFKAAALGTQKLAKYLEDNKEKDIESIAEATQVANIVKTIMPISDFWAKGLAIDRLLAKLEADDDD